MLFCFLNNKSEITKIILKTPDRRNKLQSGDRRAHFGGFLHEGPPAEWRLLEEIKVRLRNRLS